ncbi:MAG TPA: prepilin peptidase [Tepidisphaeraceae bacterium]|jgi:leader peptidase (prepilin peptidase)/N-methyltransferase
MEFNDPLIAIFVFAIGACVGSFLNVVVYRMPLGQSLVTPPSACPKCGHRLAARDNIPIFGWLLLRGKCRYCGNPIAPRYPLVELLTALLFVGHYWLLFRHGWGPYEQVTVQTIYGVTADLIRPLRLENDWPILLLHVWLIGALLAASLIDLEHFIIPLEICWLTALVGVAGQALGRPPGSLGSLHFGPIVDAMTLGAGVGLLIAIGLLRVGWLKRSFEDDAPLLEKDVEMIPEADRPNPWPASRIRAEMRREMLFVLPILLLSFAAAFLVMKVPTVAAWWDGWAAQRHVSGALGALAGGLIGGGVVWLFRILGSYGFGREAMGLGDVHLMFGVGCVIGPGAATVAFFIAPAFGLTIALIQLFVNGRREIPYGPYLSLATYAVMLCYTPIAMYLAPGFEGLLWAGRSLINGGTP